MSYKIGVRRIDLTVRRFYETHEEGVDVLDRIASIESLSSFTSKTTTDDGTTVKFGGDETSPQNWFMLDAGENGQLEISARFMGNNRAYFMELFESTLREVETVVIETYETELRINTSFDELVGLPVEHEPEPTVTGIELLENDWSYRFSDISDGNDETVVIVNLTNDETVRPPFQPFYDDQVEHMVDFVKEYIPTTATI